MSGFDPKDSIKQMAAAKDVATANDVFWRAGRAFGYQYYDGVSFNATLLADPQRAADFYEGNYPAADFARFIPRGWPADDEVTQLVARSSSPIDYLGALRAAPRSASILTQLGILTFARVRHSWLFPCNTLGHLRCATVYAVGDKPAAEKILAARDLLAPLAAFYLDRLQEFHRPSDTDPASARLNVARVPVDLNSRELNYLNLLSQGQTNAQIARALDVSENTVKYHLKRLFQKLDVASRAGAVALAVEYGILPGKPLP